MNNEIKADRGFDDNQVEKLINLANELQVDFLVFSTLKDENSEEVKKLFI